MKGFAVKGGNGAGGGGGGLGAGGAIYVRGGTLTVEKSTFEGNGAVGGNGSHNGPTTNGGGGGGLAGNGGAPFSAAFAGGGGGGGARGNGGRGDVYSFAGGAGGGGGGTIEDGESGDSNADLGTGQLAGGLDCGGAGGYTDIGFGGDDGEQGQCRGGGGGGGESYRPIVGFGVNGNGGDGNYGGGGGGAGYDLGDGGDGGFGGGGGSGTTYESTLAGFGPNGGDGGFGGGGGAGHGGFISGGPGAGGTFGGRADVENGGGGAALGGAIFGDDATITILNSTFTANAVSHGLSGGGTADPGADAGGAVFLVAGSLTVSNATISGNEATGEGGGIGVYRPTTGAATTFVLKNSIVANNGAKECFFRNSSGGSVTTTGSTGNLVMASAGLSNPEFACPAIVASADPQLQPLALNFPGRTPTMALPFSSPAVDAVTSGEQVDQRLVLRPYGVQYDIGAFEAADLPPTTTITLSPASPDGSNGWYRQAVGVSVSATDREGAVAQTRCVLDPASAPTTFADLPDASCAVTSVGSDGLHTLYAASIDTNGHAESPPVTATFRIDRTKPVTTADASPYTFGSWTAQNVTVTLSAADTGGSGVATTYYDIDDPTCTSASAGNCRTYSGPFTVTGDGTHTVTYFSADGAGNIETAHTATVRIDQAPPVTSITLDPASPDVGAWYVFAVKVSVTATDGGSGVAGTRCQLDVPATGDYGNLNPGCAYLAPGSSVLSEGLHTVYAASIDAAGNKETIKKVSFGIDKTGPASSIDPLAPFQAAASFPVTWSGADNLSGVRDYTVRYRQAASGGAFGAVTGWLSQTTATGASFTAPAGSTTCFSVRARDNAGWLTTAYSPERCTTVPLDDPALSRIGLWQTVSGPGYHGPGVSRSTAIGNRLSASMRGQTIGVLVTKQPGGGSVELRWSGFTKLTASLSAPTVQKQQLLTFTLPGVQTGTLEIVQTGYGTVDIDAAGANKTS